MFVTSPSSYTPAYCILYWKRLGVYILEAESYFREFDGWLLDISNPHTTTFYSLSPAFVFVNKFTSFCYMKDLVSFSGHSSLYFRLFDFIWQCSLPALRKLFSSNRMKYSFLDGVIWRKGFQYNFFLRLAISDPLFRVFLHSSFWSNKINWAHVLWRYSTWQFQAKS